MKLQETVTDLEVDGSFEATEMQIELSAHAYSVLSKGLYSDPYKAIVRELCCNAWDSHVEAGKTTTPFEVCLPNAMEPTFRVRDFGIGLPPEKIKTLYTYFKSTKQGSDLQTGCFGLGSKSPFAYTKKFTAISHFNGKKYHFSVYIDARGIPGTMLMAENPTDEPNGIEVSFTVEPQDFQSFYAAAQEALRPFTMKPVIRGVHGVFFRDVAPPFLEGKGWRLYEGENPQAVMGNVRYPLRVEARSGFSVNAKKLMRSRLDVDFPLGAFEITPSRESVQYTEYSIANINERLEAIYDEIVTYVTNKIAGAKSLWQASIESRKLVERGPLADMQLHTTWHGKSVNAVMGVPKDFNLMFIKASQPRAVDGVTPSGNAASISRQEQGVRPHEVKFYFADFPGAMGRVCNHVRDSFTRLAGCYVIIPVVEETESDPRFFTYKTTHPSTTYNPYTPTITKRKLVFDTAKLPAFLDAFGILASDVVMASALPQRTRAASSRQARLVGSQARAFKFDACGRGKASDNYWQEADVDLAAIKHGVYIEINKWKFVGSELADKPAEFKAWLRKFENAGCKLPAEGLVGVKTADMKKFQAAKNWVTLDTYVTKVLKDAWQSPEFQLSVRVLRMHSEQRSYLTDLASFHSHSATLSPQFKQLVDQVHQVISTMSKVDSFMGAVGCLCDDAWQKEMNARDCAADALVHEATTRYPLLPAVLPVVFSHKSVHVIEYARLIDNQGK